MERVDRITRHPIAVALGRADSIPGGYARTEQLLRGFDRGVRLVAAVIAATYLRRLRDGQPRIAELDSALSPLARPSLGHWVGIVRCGAAALPNLADDVRTLAFKHEAALTRLVELRNARAHAEDDSGDPQIEKLTRVFLDDVATCRSLRMAVVAGDARYDVPWLAEPRAERATQTTGDLAVSAPRIVVGDDALDLAPLVVAGDDAGGQLEVFLYHGRHRKQPRLLHMPASRGGTQYLRRPDHEDVLVASFDLLVRPDAAPYRSPAASPLAGSPFRKLRPFAVGDADVFFGRDTTIRDVCDAIDERPLLVLHAPSGTGKTSLLQAGVRPAVDDVYIWIEVESRGDVIAALRARIEDALRLRGEPAEGELGEVVRRLGIAAGRPLVIVLDAFEEAFRGPDADVDARSLAIAAALRDLAANAPTAHVVLSLRSDCLADLDRLKEAGVDEIYRDTLQVRPLDASAARQALVAPLARVGLRVPRRLADRIVSDLSPDGHALQAVELALVGDAIYEGARERDLLPADSHTPRDIDASIYDSLGGAGTILATYVRRTLDALTPAIRARARAIFYALLGVQGVREPPMRTPAIAERANLAVDEVASTCQQLVEDRLLQAVAAGTFRIAHDLVALELFTQLGEEDRRALEVRDALEAAARAWDRAGKPNRGFPSERQLGFYEQARGTSMLARDFLARARRAAIRRRRLERGALVGFAVVAAAATLGAVMTVRTNRDLRRTLRDALIWQSIALKQQPGRAIDAADSALRALALDGRPIEEAPADLRVAISATGSAATTGVLTRVIESTDAVARSVRFSPDGTLLAIGGGNGTLDLVDAVSGRRVRSLGKHGDQIGDLAWSPDGKRIVAGMIDGRVAVVDTASGALLAQLTGGAKPILAVAYTPDGTRFASASQDGNVRIFAAATLAVQTTIRGHTSDVRRVAVSPDGTRIASAGFDGSVRILDRTTLRELLALDLVKGEVSTVVWSPDGKLILAGGAEGVAKLYRDDGSMACELQGHSSTVWGGGFSGDGLRVVTGSFDATALVFDVASCKQIAELEHEKAVNAAILSRDGTQAVTGSADGLARVWDVKRQAVAKEIRVLAGSVYDLAFSATEDAIFAGGTDASARRVPLANPPGFTSFVGHGGAIERLAVAADGRLLATAGLADKSLLLWDVASGVEQHRWVFDDKVYGVAFTPDGDELIGTSFDDTLRIFSTKPPFAERARATPHAGGVNAIAFTPDSKLLVTGGHDRCLRTWDVATGTARTSCRKLATAPLATLALGKDRFLAGLGGGQLVEGQLLDPAPPELASDAVHADTLFSIAAAPAAGLLVSGSNDNTVRVFTLDRREPLATWSNDRSAWVVDIDPTGSRIAVASEGKPPTLILRDRKPLIRSWAATAGTVAAIALSPSKQLLATADSEKLGALWDAATGKRVGLLTGHSDALTSIRFAPDGKQVVTASKDNRILVWSVPDGKLVRTLRVHSGAVYRAVPLRDGTIVSIGADNTLVLSSPAIGDAVARVSIVGPYTLAVSPDERVVAVGRLRGVVELYSLPALQRTRELVAHPVAVNDLAFCEDSRRLVSASDDKSAAVWDLASPNTPPISFRGHTEIVNAVIFLDGCRSVATASADQTVGVWDAATGVRQLSIARYDSGDAAGGIVETNGRLLYGETGYVIDAPLDIQSYLQLACAAVADAPSTEASSVCAEAWRALAVRPRWW